MMGTELGLETSVIFNQLTFGFGCILMKIVFILTYLEYVSRLIALENFINFGFLKASDFTVQINNCRHDNGIRL
jgi:hypothetical protein